VYTGGGGAPSTSKSVTASPVGNAGGGRAAAREELQRQIEDERVEAMRQRAMVQEEAERKAARETIAKRYPDYSEHRAASATKAAAAAAAAGGRGSAAAILAAKRELSFGGPGGGGGAHGAPRLSQGRASQIGGDGDGGGSGDGSGGAEQVALLTPKSLVKKMQTESATLYFY
jgi:hypothetical protein